MIVVGVSKINAFGIRGNEGVSNRSRKTEEATLKGTF